MHEARSRAAGRGARVMGFTASILAAIGAAGCNDASSVAGPVAPARQAMLSAGDASGVRVGGVAGQVIPDEYIVTFRDDVADVPGLARQMAAQHGGSLRFTYDAAIKGFSAHMSAKAAEALARNPNVARVEQDATVPLADVQNGADWGIDRIDQRALPLNSQYTYAGTGAGVTVYVVDNGIRLSHVEFGGRATLGYSSISDGRNGGECSGHGTHVAGLVGSRQYGVAKGARLVSVRVYDCNGSSTLSGMVGGVDWVTKNAQRPAVVNMSLGGAYLATLNQAVQNSIGAGITYVVSAGNQSTDACTISPASVPAAITVGASTPADEQASFSNFGSCVDLYAPGVSILSTFASSDTASNWLSGTSMAAPLVTGAAALYLAAHPTAQPAEVAAALTSAATRGALTRVGAGSPNLLLFTAAAADPTISPVTPAPSPDAPPVASFVAQCARARCTFDGSTSTDDRGIVSYRWEFGDGTSTTTAVPTPVSRSYAGAGTYVAALTVTDASGQTMRTIREVRIRKL